MTTKSNPAKGVNRASCFAALRTNGADNRSAVLLLGIFVFLLCGCSRQQDSQASPRERLPDNRQIAFSEIRDRTLEDPPGALPKESRLPLYELKMAPRDLAQLERNAYSNDTYPATFVADGEVYNNVKVRFRGAWARSWP